VTALGYGVHRALPCRRSALDRLTDWLLRPFPPPAWHALRGAGGRTRGEGRGVHDQSLVIAAVEVRQRKPENVKGVPRRNGRYAGRIRMEAVPDRSARSLCGFVEAAVEPGAVVVTDAWGGYATLPDRGYRHLPVAAQGDPSVAEDFLPISHLIFSNLKSWLRGCHHGVSPQHLQAYLNEFTFRFNRRFYPFNAFRSLLISGQAVAPTYDGLYTGSWQHPKEAFSTLCWRSFRFKSGYPGFVLRQPVVYLDPRHLGANENMKLRAHARIVIE
jgi:hypothetical protein